MESTEVVRLLGSPIIGGLVALLVARLAVPWALARFKQERLWERKLQAYLDLLSSLRMMHEAKQGLYELVETTHPGKDAHRSTLEGHYRAGLDLVRANIRVAELLLPGKLVRVLVDFSAQMCTVPTSDDWEEIFSRDLGLIARVIDDLTRLARADLMR